MTKKRSTRQQQVLALIRQAVADYQFSEGCGCCGDYDAHRMHHERLGLLLGVPKRKGYHDFTKYRSAGK